MVPCLSIRCDILFNYFYPIDSYNRDALRTFLFKKKNENFAKDNITSLRIKSIIFFLKKKKRSSLIDLGRSNSYFLTS